MINNLKGKKLLVIGGAFQHCKVVEAAKDLGITVYVTDYLDEADSPAKLIADKSYTHDIFDIDAIVDMCRAEKIDGVIALCLDACQIPYQQVCEKLGLPCFGTAEQFKILTDKNAFKQFCKNTKVDTIPDYIEQDFNNKEICEEKVSFPILIKPANSRGSRGASICNSYDEAVKGIQFAKSESSTEEVVIEKYMKDNDEFTMSYIVINGDPILVRTGDRFTGSAEDKMDKLAIAGISPSKHTDFYIEKVDSNVVDMIKKLGIKNGPVFMQGFLDGDTVRFFDPGFRFPGIEYERMYTTIYNIDIIKALVEFAVTGKISDHYTQIDHNAKLNGKFAVDLLVAIKPGKIRKIYGENDVKNHPNVVSMFKKYNEGDEVGVHFNVNQRFCEIDIVADTIGEMIDIITWIYDTLIVENEFLENMVFSKLDLNILKNNY